MSRKAAEGKKKKVEVMDEPEEKSKGKEGKSKTPIVSKKTEKSSLNKRKDNQTDQASSSKKVARKKGPGSGQGSFSLRSMVRKHESLPLPEVPVKRSIGLWNDRESEPSSNEGSTTHGSSQLTVTSDVGYAKKTAYDEHSLRSSYRSSFSGNHPSYDRNRYNKGYSKSRSKYSHQNILERKETGRMQSLGEQFTEFKRRNPDSKMTPQEFQEFKDTKLALDSLVQAKNHMRFSYIWKSTRLPKSEPRIFFNTALRQQYIKRIVVPIHMNIHEQIRNEWTKKAIELSEKIDSFLLNQGNEMTHFYDESLILDNLEDSLNWSLTEYVQWINPDLEIFLEYLKDYVRCRREGIPAVKLPPPTYLKHTKYLWSSKCLTETKGRVKYTESMQEARLKYILIDHVVYQDLDPNYRKYWCDWIRVLQEMCDHFMNYRWPICDRDKSGPNYLAVKKHLGEFSFPINDYYNIPGQNGFDITDHLIDHMYCIHFGIEQEKLWNYEFFGLKGDSYLDVRKKLKKSKKKKSKEIDPSSNNNDEGSNTPINFEDDPSTSSVKNAEHKSSENDDSGSNGMDEDVDMDSPSPDEPEEEIPLVEGPEETEKSLRSSRFANLIRYDKLFGKENLRGKENEHFYFRRARYNHVLEDKIKFDDMYMTMLKKRAENDFTSYMTHFFNKDIHKKLNVNDIPDEELDQRIEQGVHVIKNVNKIYGFDLGFIEEFIMNPDPTKEKQDSKLKEDRYSLKTPCFCPFNENVFINYGLSNDDDICGPCDCTKGLSNMDLLSHLCDMAFVKGCVAHLAILHYVKNACIVSNGRNTIYHRHITDFEATIALEPDFKDLKKPEEPDNNSTNSNKNDVSNYSSLSYNNINYCSCTPSFNKTEVYQKNDDESSYSSSSSGTYDIFSPDDLKYKFIIRFLSNIGNDIIEENSEKKDIDFFFELNLMSNINDNVIIQHDRKMDRSIRKLKRNIDQICGKYLMNNPRDFVHYNIYHVHRFLNNLCHNKVWDLGLKANRLWSRNTTKECGHNPPVICICPCSKLMTVWHQRYISRRDAWKEHIQTVPCQAEIMDINQFISHVSLFRNKDMYHEVIYSILKDVYEIN